MRIFPVSAILVLAFSSVTVLGNPGYKVHLSRKGLDFATIAGGGAVVKAVKDAKIPDFEINEVGVAFLKLKDIKFKQFRGQHWFYGLKPPSTITYGLTGASLEIDGNFLGKAHLFIIPDIKVPGNLKVTAKNVALSLTNAVTLDPKGRPILEATHCSATLGSFNLDLGGSVVAWILELFHKLISDALKPLISKAICGNAMKTINTNIKELIQKQLPSPVPLGKGFDFNYRIEHVHMSQVGIDLDGDGSLQFMGKGVSGLVSGPLDTSGDKTSKMGYVWISDYILSSAAQLAHEHGITKVEVSKKKFPQAAGFLKTKCPGAICLGSLMKELAVDYPNDTCVVKVGTNIPPVFTFDTKGVHLTLDLGLTFGIYRGSAAPDNFAAANISAAATLIPTASPLGLNGTFTLTEFATKEIFSNLKEPINWMFIENYGKYLLNSQLHKLVAKGFKFPDLKGVRFVAPEVLTTKHTLKVATDLAYTPQ